MKSRLSDRLTKIEMHRAGPAAYFVELSADAWDHGYEHLERVMEEAICEHRARTGYGGRVLIGPKPCETEEEWLQRYGHPRCQRKFPTDTRERR
jgi:hypothetical protein